MFDPDDDDSIVFYDCEELAKSIFGNVGTITNIVADVHTDAITDVYLKLRFLDACRLTANNYLWSGQIYLNADGSEYAVYEYNSREIADDYALIATKTFSEDSFPKLVPWGLYEWKILEPYTVLSFCEKYYRIAKNETDANVRKRLRKGELLEKNKTNWWFLLNKTKEAYPFFLFIILVVCCVVSLFYDGKTDDAQRTVEQSNDSYVVNSGDGSGMLIREGAYDYVDNSTLIPLSDVDADFPYQSDLDYSSGAQYACLDDGTEVEVIRFKKAGNYEWALIYDQDGEYWICSKENDTGQSYISKQ